MADIHLTNGDDVYIQPLSDKDNYNNVYGDDGNDVIKMYSGTAVGGKGDDRFEFIPTPGEPWREMGVAYWGSPNGIEVNLAEGWANDGFGGHDTLIGIRRVHGAGDDKFTGDGADNFFHPNGGHDTIDGGAGYDGIDVREIAPNADGSGTWRPAVLGDLSIDVSPDARTATISVTHYPRITYTLSNIEYFNLINDDRRYLLADFITPQSMAEQTIAAGGTARWNAPGALGTAVSVSFSFVEAAPSSGPGASGFRAFTGAERQAVRDMLHDTSLVAGINLVEVTESQGVTGTMRFGVSQQAATKGVAYAPNTASGNPTAGDVWMDVESMQGLSPGSEGFAALRHEIGHALGLRHPTNSDLGDAWSQVLRPVDDRSSFSVMSSNASADGLFRADWGPLDIAALRYLYGIQTVNLGNSVFQVGALDAQAQRTLVDDGGIDTLNASLSPVGVTLDLTPGHTSSVGLSAQGLAGVENLGLAVGTLIENAVGSAGDDVLLGNALDNRLEGMAGNDWVDGAVGIDTAVFAGARASYFVSTGFGKVFVAARDGVAGFDTLLRIERLAFGDGEVVLAGAALASDVRLSLDEDSSAQASLPDPSDQARAGVTYAKADEPAHGSLSISASGEYSYLPQPDYNGTDSFGYRISDSSGAANSYRVYIELAPVNDAPTGSILVQGTATRGQWLSANALGLADVDGLGAMAYQWLRDGVAIDGATGASYRLTRAEVGKGISVVASYTDSFGSHESRTSLATPAVANANAAPTGSVTISGSAMPGQTLNAAHNLADADGLGSIGYQWRADGVAIALATQGSLGMTQAQTGKTITVTASYVDGDGNAEAVTGGFARPVSLLAFSWKAHTLLSGVHSEGNGHSGMTDGGGAATLEGVSDIVLTLDANRAMPAMEAAASASAVNLQDAIAILKMIVGLEVNGANKPLSPYQALAADFDGNGSVGLTDAIGVLKHVVGLPSPEPTWHFANDADTSIPARAGLSPGLAPAISAELGWNSPVHVGLVGYLSGDVDGSYAGALGAADLDTTQPDYFTALVAAHPGLSLAQFGVYS